MLIEECGCEDGDGEFATVVYLCYQRRFIGLLGYVNDCCGKYASTRNAWQFEVGFFSVLDSQSLGTTGRELYSCEGDEVKSNPV